MASIIYLWAVWETKSRIKSLFFWPVFETLTEINHFMDPCVLYSIPFPLGVRWSGEYLPCRGWTIVYCPVSEAPVCSQCKILIMPLHLPLLDGKFILILNLWLNTINRLFLWKRFLVFFFAFRTVLNLLFPLLEEVLILNFQDWSSPKKRFFSLIIFRPLTFSSFNNSSFFVVFKSLLSGFVGFLYKVLEGVTLIEEQENVWSIQFISVT